MFYRRGTAMRYIPAMAIYSPRMFYRGASMREMPCCRQHLCCFCLSEFVRSKLTKLQPGGTDSAGGGKASPSPEEVPSARVIMFTSTTWYFYCLLLTTRWAQCCCLRAWRARTAPQWGTVSRSACSTARCVPILHLAIMANYIQPPPGRPAAPDGEHNANTCIAPYPAFFSAPRPPTPGAQA